MIRLDQTESTNRTLWAMAEDGAVDGTAVLAREQTAGMGRLGRSWLAAPGEAVLLSVLIRRPMPASRVPLLTLAAAVAVADAVPGLGIKWPNDLLAPDGRKVCGILAQAEFRAGQLDFAVVGIGLNVHGAPGLETATSLSAVWPDRVFDVDELAEGIAAGLHGLAAIVASDPAAVLERWRARSMTIGQRVRVGAVEGLATDIDASGALIVQNGQGTQRILAGDVEMISPSRPGSS